MISTIVPAAVGFEVLYIDNNDDGYSRAPVIAWSFDSDLNPTPITANGLHADSDVALRYPGGMILYDGRHYTEPSAWIFAVEARARSKDS